MEALIPIAIVGSIILMVGGGIYWAYVADKKRTEALQEQAESMGLRFVKDAGDHVRQRFERFALFNRGRSRKVKNLIEGDSGEVKISIFDYTYVTGSGKHTKHHNQTIAALQSPSLVCPEFSIRPEGFFDRIGSAIGFQDINFESHPEFSRLFVLKGPDESAIREFLRPAILEYFQGHAGITLEAGHDTMFFYRASTRSKPEQLKDLLSQAYEAYGVLTDVG
jgi:hypothetical protein